MLMKKIMAILLAFCVIFILAGCTSQGKMTRRDETRQAIEQAKQKATVTCATQAQCKKAFIFAEIFVSENSFMKIRHSDDRMILTFNPDYNGRIGLAVQKTPAVDESATISLIAVCKNMDRQTIWGTYPYFDECAGKLMKVYNGFKPYIESRLPSGQYRHGLIRREN